MWEQYDSSVMADTIQGPGGDAAVVRVHGTVKALALTSDCTPRYVAADAREGARQAVAEAWRNLTATGARPLAITDCLNFGNPEKPEIMGQFAEAVGGMGEACKALDFPVVSGNVSLYNETQGQAIPPTPVVGGVGLIDDAAKAVNVAFKDKGEGHRRHRRHRRPPRSVALSARDRGARRGAAAAGRPWRPRKGTATWCGK